MHRLHNRAANAGSRVEARSGYSVENGTGMSAEQKNGHNGQEMRVYTKGKAFSSSRTPYL